MQRPLEPQGRCGSQVKGQLFQRAIVNRWMNEIRRKDFSAKNIRIEQGVEKVEEGDPERLESLSLSKAKKWSPIILQ